MSKAGARYGLLVAIAIGFILGIFIGWLVSVATPSQVQKDVSAWLKAFGDIFVRMIRIVIPPLIFFTIAAATSSIADARRLGRILIYMVALYIVTTIIAAIWGIIGASVVMPGAGLNLTVKYTPPTPPTGVDILLSFFQTDFNALLAVGGAMTMIIFAIILGLAVTFLGEEGRKVANLLSLGSKTMIGFVRIIMYYAPVAVFAYAAWLMIQYGPQMLGAYAKFLGTQYALTIFHFLVVYSVVVWLGGLNPVKYFKAQIYPFIIAFTTRSSAATLPANMEAAKRMGVPEEVFGVTLPIGATVNMDGTALYQVMSALFIAQLFNIPLTPYHYGLLVFAALVGSIATAAIPGGGTIMLAYVLAVMGLPLEGIGIMLVIDTIADAIRTAINVSGDNACTVLITKILGYKLQPQV
ncbi:MAG: dicarboxylate/amino acid:cation symporter [Zestosphaera sp.]